MNDDRTSVPMDDNMSLDSAVPSKSKYLSKEDVEQPMLVQIYIMTTDQVETEGVPEDRAVLHFHGDVKPMILNNTNKELLKAITGATTVGGIRNQQVVLYNDPTIMFGRKMVGGIRIRSAQPVAPMAYPAATPPVAGTYPPPPVMATPQPETGNADVPFDDTIPY